MAEASGTLEAERVAIEVSFQSAVRAAEETARCEPFDSFLGEISVEEGTIRRKTAGWARTAGR